MNDDVTRHSIAPAVHLLKSQIDGMKDIGWDTALGDMLDNSLDAGASRVEIEMNSRDKIVRITDDGCGCAELWRMFQSGYTTKDGKRGVLGRYGVGFKTVSQYLCGWDGQTRVASVCDGVARSTINRWRQVHDNDWDAAPQNILSDPSDASRQIPWGKGTRVEFSKVRRQFPNQKTLPSMLSRLAFWFTPALRSSRSIVVVHNGTTHHLAAVADPSMDKIIHDTIRVGSRTAEIRVGLRSHGANPRLYGLNYCYGHRVITSNSSAGCGDYQANGIFGWVNLDDSWKLAADKTCVTDQEGDKLYDAICCRIEELLVEASQRADEVRSAALAIEVERIINDANGREAGERGRQKRRQGSSHGTHPSLLGEPRPVTTDEVDGSGKDRKKSAGVASLRITWVDADPEERGRAAWASIQPVGDVHLNRSIPIVADAHKRGDSTFITMLAATAYYHSLTVGPLSRAMKKPVTESFDELVGKLLRKGFRYDISVPKTPKAV